MNLSREIPLSFQGVNIIFKIKRSLMINKNKFNCHPLKNLIEISDFYQHNVNETSQDF